MKIENNSQYVFLTLQVPVEIEIHKVSDELTEINNVYSITAECRVNDKNYRAGIHSTGEIDAVQKRVILNRLQRTLIDKITEDTRITKETQICN